MMGRRGVEGWGWGWRCRDVIPSKENCIETRRFLFLSICRSVLLCCPFFLFRFRTCSVIHICIPLPFSILSDAYLSFTSTSIRHAHCYAYAYTLIYTGYNTNELRIVYAFPFFSLPRSLLVIVHFGYVSLVISFSITYCFVSCLVGGINLFYVFVSLE
ncbi:hypothetical protein BJ165DRAFT_647551 [Panaeolus papilionaceus]|nr:hypothetical protein BJ165DRAFT_647551 [Panaeolus papilionaceus]